MQPKQFTRVNVSNAEINFSADTDCQQPNKLITFLDEGPFVADVYIKPVVMERIFDSVEIELVNLADNLVIESELPAVSLKLSGSMPVLENYILSKHAVQLNLRDISEPGEYELPLRYVIPANLQLIEKSDEELLIKVIKKAEEKNEAENTEAGNAAGFGGAAQ